ncbi:MAG: methyl-accepting chemotaxis protein [Planctomycetes bacterium]|nr:methyl-accepting chemotaxis protein [Planctomycetota bacterium]
MRIKWSIARKLYGGFGINVVLFAVFGVFVVDKLLEFRNDIANYRTIQQKVETARVLQMHIINIWQFMTDASLTKEQSVIDTDVKREILQANNEINTLIKLAGDDVNTADNARNISESIGNINGLGVKMFNGYAGSWETGNAIMPEFDRACNSLKTDIDNFVAGIKLESETACNEMNQMISTSIKTCLVTGIILLALSIIIGAFLTKGITGPLSLVMDSAGKIADGNLKQDAIKVKNTDEIGKLAETFNAMLARLNSIVEQAERIADGAIGADEIERKMAGGMDMSSAIGEIKACGDLEKAFARMQNELRKLTIQARRIAEDDLHNEALKLRIPGELGNAFSSMTSNLIALADTAEKIADGDLKTEYAAKSGSAVLSNAFAKMLSNLKELINKINKEIEQVNAVSQTFAVVADESAKSSTQLSQAIQQIAKASGDAAQSAQNASGAGINAKELSKNGRNKLQQMLVKVEMIRKSMIASVENIRKLSDRSTEISEMVSLITDISDQTNLLSLNAAIEAARAGDVGKGFAVVASEIRKLADSSQQQTQRVSHVIQDILRETASAQTATEKEAEIVNEGIALIEVINSMFLEIAQQIESIAMQMEQIAANAEETSASTQEVTAQAEEQNASIEEMSSSAVQLKSSAFALRHSIERFRI